MSAVIIDRRFNNKGKSSVNRRKFIKRVKDQLKSGIKDIVRDTNLKELVKDGGKKIKIPARNLNEPHFHHDGTGINDIVRPGNDQFMPGDKIPRPSGGSDSGSKGSKDGESEDQFTFHLTKEEFFDIFFDNCELPDMVKRNLAIHNEEMRQRVGFSSSGAPSQLNIVRSMRFAKSRKFGLRAMKAKKLKRLEELEQQLLARIASGSGTALEQEQLARVQHDIVVLKRKMDAIPFIDPIDLRYNNWDRVQIPTSQAVMFCIMDVSGSMDERMKELAKTFYLLLYLFLQKDYTNIDIVFIRYHTKAEIVDEHEFYYGTDSGGTITSTGLNLAYDTIMDKYPQDTWNIYMAHASDGDNWAIDNETVTKVLTEGILPLVQYYAYVHIATNGQEPSADEDNLWNLFSAITKTEKKLSIAVVSNENEVYPVFIKLFTKASNDKN